MSRRLMLLLVGLFVAAPTRAPAQRTLRTIGTDLKNGFGDIWYIWSSPFHASGRDWTIAAASFGAFGLTSLADDEINRWILRNPDSAPINALDPWRVGADVPLADLGSGKLLQPIVGVTYLAGFILDKPAIRDAAIGCAASQQANSLVRSVVYRVVGRTRPDSLPFDQYSFDVPGGKWIEHSFFGGHAANAVGCATFLSERFELGLLEPAFYVLAAGVAFGRMADQAHWTSDTMLGTIFGYAIGKNIARRSLARARSRGATPESEDASNAHDDASSRWYVTNGAAGVVIGWRRVF